jgi:Glyoxalase-like domain
VTWCRPIEPTLFDGVGGASTARIVRHMSESTDQPKPPVVYMVLDAVDVDRLAGFWAEALRYRRVDRLEQYEVLIPLEGNTGSVFLVQGVPEAKQVKNRMHLDLHVADPEAEAARLIALGATRLGDGQLADIRWITMADPEGNEFDIGLDG